MSLYIFSRYTIEKAVLTTLSSSAWESWSRRLSIDDVFGLLDGVS